MCTERAAQRAQVGAAGTAAGQVAQQSQQGVPVCVLLGPFPGLVCCRP